MREGPNAKRIHIEYEDGSFKKLTEHCFVFSVSGRDGPNAEMTFSAMMTDNTDLLLAYGVFQQEVRARGLIKGG